MIQWVEWAIMLIIGVVVIGLWVSLVKLRKAYKRLMNGSASDNLESVLYKLQDDIKGLQETLGVMKTKIDRMESNMSNMKTKVGIYRYNAFGERGSDLSFSIAVLSERKDGVVLTGIHTRDSTFMYAKPVQGGQSLYKLSPEEQEAIIRSFEHGPK